MAIKIFTNTDNTATFKCPKCETAKIVDVTKYINSPKKTKLKAKCGCGHSYEVFLDKRKNFRKETNLPGVYKYSVNGQAPNQGPEHAGTMTVLDISTTGLRLKVNAMPRFKVGDMLNLEFTLDDKNRSEIRKRVIVRNLRGFTIGVELDTAQAKSEPLAFYLFH